MEIIRGFLEEEDYKKYIETVSSILPPQHGLSDKNFQHRLHLLTSLRRLGPLFITRTCRIQSEPGRTKVIACPFPLNETNDSTTDLFMLFDETGKVRFLWWTLMNDGTPRLEIGPAAEWPFGDFRFSPTLLFDLFVSWQKHRRYDAEAFVCYNASRFPAHEKGIGEIIWPRGPKNKPARIKEPPKDEDFPFFDQQQKEWPLNLVPVLGARRWLSYSNNKLILVNADRTVLGNISWTASFPIRILAAFCENDSGKLFFLTNSMEIYLWDYQNKNQPERLHTDIPNRPTSISRIKTVSGTSRYRLILSAWGGILGILNDEDKEVVEELVFIPSTIFHINRHSRDPSHGLIFRVDGSIEGIKLRLRPEPDERLKQFTSFILQKPPNWSRLQDFLLTLDFKGDQLYPSPKLVLHSLWDEVIKDDTKARETWKALISWACENNPWNQEEAKLSRLLRIIADVIMDTPFRPGGEEKLSEVDSEFTKLTKESLFKLATTFDEATIALLCQRLPFLQSYCKDTLISFKDDKLRDIVNTIKKGRAKLYSVKVKGIFALKRPVRHLLSFDNGESLIVADTQKIHYLKGENLSYEKDYSWEKIDSFSWKDLSFKSRLRLILHIEGYKFLLVSRLGEVALIEWKKEEKKIILTKNLDFYCYCGALNKEIGHILLGGVDYQGRAVIYWNVVKDLLNQKDSWERPWQSETPGRIVGMAFSNACVYAVDENGGQIWRSPIHHGKLGKFITWIKVTNAQFSSILALEKNGETNIYVGDRRGYVFSYKEEEKKTSDIVAPLLGWAYLGNPGVLSLNSLKTSKFNLITVATERDGLVILDPEKLRVTSLICHLFPAYAQVQTDKQVFAASLNGQIWSIKATRQIRNQDTHIERKCKKQWRHHEYGLCLIRTLERIENIYNSPNHKKEEINGIQNELKKFLDLNYASSSENSLPSRLEIPAPSRPLLAYMAVVIGHLVYLAKGKDLVDTMLIKRAIDWITGLPAHIHAHGALILIDLLEGQKKEDIPIVSSALDDLISYWLHKILKEVKENVRNGGPDLVLTPLLDAAFWIETQGGRRCEDTLITIFNDIIGTGQLYSKRLHRLFFQRLIKTCSKHKDPFIRLSVVWEKIIKFSFNKSKEALIFWTKEKEDYHNLGGSAAFWPAVIWEIPDVLFNNKHPSSWIEELGKAALEHPQLEAWLPLTHLIFNCLIPFYCDSFKDLKWPEVKKSFTDKASVENLNDLGQWLDDVHEKIKTLHKNFNFYKSIRNQVQYLYEVQRFLKKDIESSRRLNALERSIIEFLREINLNAINNLLFSWKENSLPQEIDLVSESDFSEQFEPPIYVRKRREFRTDNNEIRLVIEIENRWGWNLEVKPLEVDAEPRVRDIASGSKEKITVTLASNRQIHNNSKQIHLTFELRHHDMRDSQRVLTRVRIDLLQEPGELAREMKVSKEIIELLENAVSDKKNIIIQTVGDHIEDWEVETLLLSLKELFNYSILEKKIHLERQHAGPEPWVFWLRPSVPLDAVFLRMLVAPENVRWIPLELQTDPSNNNLYRQLPAYLHGPYTPSFSEVAAAMAILSLDKQEQNEWLNNLEGMLSQDVIDKISKLVPNNKHYLWLIQWLKKESKKLLSDSFWLFGAETDLEIGHLCNLKIWRKWLTKDTPPAFSGLDNESFKAIKAKLQKYSLLDHNTVSCDDIKRIFEDTLSTKLQAGSGNRDRFKVYTGEVELARRYWRVNLLVPDHGITLDGTGNFPTPDIKIIKKFDGLNLYFINEPLKRLGNGQLRAVGLTPEDLFHLLLWPKPQRLLGVKMARYLNPNELNPFRTALGLGPLVATMFHGRSSELHVIGQKVITDSQGVLISGARKIGKTSLLQKIRYEWKTKENIQVNVIYIDFQDVTPWEDNSAIEIFLSRLSKKLEIERLPNLEAAEDYLKKTYTKNKRKFVILLDEADRLFKLDLMTRPPSPEHSIKYFGQYYYYPLFSWFRKISSQEEAISFVMVSYQYGSSDETALNQWINVSQAPLYNWLYSLELGPWTREEAESFLQGALEDLGIFLRKEVIDYMINHSLNIPWILQEMGYRVLDSIDPDPLKGKWPTMAQIRQIVLDVLRKVQEILHLTAEQAVQNAKKDYQERYSSKDASEKYKLLMNDNLFWNILCAFARRNLNQTRGNSRIFHLDNFLEYLITHPEGRRIGRNAIELIFHHMGRTVLLNGKGIRQYEFAYNLLPKIEVWLAEMIERQRYE